MYMHKLILYSSFPQMATAVSPFHTHIYSMTLALLPSRRVGCSQSLISEWACVTEVNYVTSTWFSGGSQLPYKKPVYPEAAVIEDMEFLQPQLSQVPTQQPASTATHTVSHVGQPPNRAFLRLQPSRYLSMPEETTQNCPLSSPQVPTHKTTNKTKRLL